MGYGREEWRVNAVENLEEDFVGDVVGDGLCSPQ